MLCRCHGELNIGLLTGFTQDVCQIKYSREILMSKLMAQERVCRVTWNEINSDLTDKY
jgi:hypothetical protein